MGPRQARELMARQVGAKENIGHTLVDQNNHLRDIRRETLIHGEAVSILRYFWKQAIENPSFQSVVQVDEKNEISNIFWADAQMVKDYAQFGDVVVFDTTHGTNKEYRPFGVFVGLNHFRETVIFGAVLLYDQSKESFEWVFTNFLKFHNHKNPITTFTNQDAAMGQAISKVLPSTRHGLCTWHISENAARHLSCHNKGDTNYVSKFSACVYEYEEEADFEKAFKDLESKLGGTWLPFVYKDRKKWAYCYMKDAFSLGIRSTQLCESLNKDLKNYLKSDLNIVRFFEQFERLVADKRDKEVFSDFDYRKKVPRYKTNVPILLKLGQLYTPKMFEIFQVEYEMSAASQIECPTEKEYVVTVCGLDEVECKSCRVTWNPIEEKVLCSCMKFERWDILCCHGLKVLDRMNIKMMPEKYLLKRWTLQAREHIVCDRNEIIVVDTKLEVARRNRDISRKFTKIVAKACTTEETSFFFDSILDNINKQVDGKLMKLQTNPNSSNSNLCHT